jgi:hypothetical protein
MNPTRLESSGSRSSEWRLALDLWTGSLDLTREILGRSSEGSRTPDLALPRHSERIDDLRDEPTSGAEQRFLRSSSPVAFRCFASLCGTLWDLIQPPITHRKD